MSQDTVALSEGGFNRMSKGLRKAEQASRGDPQTILPVAVGFDRKCHVRITGALDGASNLYPGVFVYRQPLLASTVQKWVEADPTQVCRIETLNGETLTNGRRYEGIIVGALNSNYNPDTDPTPNSWECLPLVIVGRPVPEEGDSSDPPDCSQYYDLATKRCVYSPTFGSLIWNGTKWQAVNTITINGFVWTVSWSWANGGCCPILTLTKGTGTDTVTINIPGVCKFSGGQPIMTFTTHRSELTGVANPACGAGGSSLSFTIKCDPLNCGVNTSCCPGDLSMPRTLRFTLSGLTGEGVGFFNAAPYVNRFWDLPYTGDIIDTLDPLYRNSYGAVYTVDGLWIHVEAEFCPSVSPDSASVIIRSGGPSGSFVYFASAGSGGYPFVKHGPNVTGCGDQFPMDVATVLESDHTGLVADPGPGSASIVIP